VWFLLVALHLLIQIEGMSCSIQGQFVVILDPLVSEDLLIDDNPREQEKHQND
jgi:hypothetical protein